MKRGRAWLSMLLLASTSSYGADIYVRANVADISTDYALSKAGLVLKLANANYPSCNNKFARFYLSDFAAQSLDAEDARSRLEFARSIALAAMMANKQIEFLLKTEDGSGCIATGWIKVIN